MSPSNRQKDYLSQKVAAASPTDLIRMLYEGAIQHVGQALDGLRSGDIVRRGSSINKAIDIISELRLSLRREIDPAYCDTLASLYHYLQRQLIQAHAEESEAILKEIQSLLHTLLDGWTEAMRNLETGKHQVATLEFGDAVRPMSSSLPYETMEAKTSKRSWQL